MTFNSVTYIAFFALVLAVYWRIPHRPQNILLLVASYVFYGWWDWRFLSLMLISTIVDYTAARFMPGSARPKRLLVLSMAVNLGLLGAFKYFNFFVDSGHAFFESLGLDVSKPTLSVILPVGISFYTFQTMSYTIDVYRGALKPARSLLDFALFVSFFPQLVAGPIERATRLLPQITTPRARPNLALIESGVMLIVLGLFKKVVIADTVARAVDPIFADAATDGWQSLVFAVYGFAIQIYADFSGYSDIARGSSRLLGIELMVNFRQPYLSRSVTEFWRDWHISLSSWLRDYLYIPLGGNRRGPRRTQVNLMTTMLLGGLWHGASWTFVAWGGLQGAYLSIHRRLRPEARERHRRVPVAAGVVGPRAALSEPPAAGGVGSRERSSGGPGGGSRGGQVLATLGDGARPTPPPVPQTPGVGLPSPGTVLSVILTFHLICFSWIFFRADGFAQAWDHIAGIATLRGGSLDVHLTAAVIPAAIVMFFIDVAQRRAGDDAMLFRNHHLARGIFYGACLVAVVMFSGETGSPFIYFQF